jgi:hypothetical protein
VRLELTVLHTVEGPGSIAVPWSEGDLRWFLDTRPSMSRESPWRLEGASTTDASGRSVLDVPVETGEFSIFVRVHGAWALAASYLGGHWPRRGPRAGCNPIRDRLVLESMEEARIGLRVLGKATGHPLPGEAISLVHAQGASPSPLYPRVTTDTDGVASFVLRGYGTVERLWWVDVCA